VIIAKELIKQYASKINNHEFADIEALIMEVKPLQRASIPEIELIQWMGEVVW
jgi:hypothetical protein